MANHQRYHRLYARRYTKGQITMTTENNTDEQFSEKAHFALFTNWAVTDTIPKLKQATDGKL